MITGSGCIVLNIIRYCRLPAAVMTAVWMASGMMIYLFAPVQDRNKSLDEVEQIIYRRRAIVIWIAESAFMWVLCGFGFTDEGKGILFGNGCAVMLMLAEQIGRVRRIESPCAKDGVYVEYAGYRMYSRIRDLLVPFGISVIIAGFCCQHLQTKELKLEHSLAAIIEMHAESEQRAKEFLRDTISDMLHLLKIPVTALNIYHKIILQELNDAAAVRTFAVLSEQEPGRIESLVQSLLKMAQLDTGAVIFDPAPENLSELMEYIGQKYSFRARQEGKEITWKGDDTAILFCDRLWVQEAMGNLIKNALDRTGPGDRILIRWQQSYGLTQVIIEDTGSVSGNNCGLDLGLSLAESIIEAHQGSIEVRSRQGQGTVFTVRFPNRTK